MLSCSYRSARPSDTLWLHVRSAESGSSGLTIVAAALTLKLSATAPQKFDTATGISPATFSVIFAGLGG